MDVFNRILHKNINEIEYIAIGLAIGEMDYTSKILFKSIKSIKKEFEKLMVRQINNNHKISKQIDEIRKKLER